MDKLSPFIAHHWFLVVLFVGLFIAVILYEKRSQGQSASGIKPEMAVQLMNKSHAIIIDTRSAEQFAAGHIIKSRHIVSSDLEKKLKSLQKYKQKPIIVIANQQPEVARAIKLMKANGFTDVVTIAGGIKAWGDASLPLEKESS